MDSEGDDPDNANMAVYSEAGHFCIKNEMRVTIIFWKTPTNAVEGISALGGGKTFAFHCLFGL